MNEVVSTSINWVAVSGFIGLILPVVIELFSKKVTGKAKILVVWGSCIACAFAQHGVDGGFQNWNWGQFSISVVIILTLATKQWNEMWKKWFPDTPNPVPQKTDTKDPNPTWEAIEG